MTRIPLPKLNVARQALDLARFYPGSEVKTGPSRLIWLGELTPTTICQAYKVRIDYTGYRRPNITVLSPRLVPPKGMKLKHVFAGDHPCVHMHHDWDPSMSIATTIVPWLSEWLLHHEVYQATGTWTGGGHEPGPRTGPSIERTATRRGRRSLL